MSDQTADLFDTAADILEKDGWTQGQLFSYQTSSGPVCLAGALNRAATGKAGKSCAHTLEALQILDRLLLDPTSTPFDPKPITPRSVHWNDQSERTQQEVLDLLRLAAKKERLTRRLPPVQSHQFLIY